ncbi:S53 family peptidase [Streptomyces sp. RB6PN25]|uniref:S53 family peptidase n=1 Tax=Streptomyces humicola TaxID=2953240 RepID=A0ABT1PN04_9ACTN|nr:S53 family peptidase [Streptomyces humicola]MCQ4079046.1 S53 family peptidase [Streptomyces humicola]
MRRNPATRGAAPSRAIRTTAVAFTAGATALALGMAPTSITASTKALAADSARPGAMIRPISVGEHMAGVHAAPITTSQCVSQFGIHCYSPLQYRNAYNLNPLYSKGITGKGRTIVIVDSFGSPTIQNDLHVFDKQWGLPDTNVDVVKWGSVPPFNPGDSDMSGWAGETTLDVEYAHAIAPDARIVLVETGVSETEGTQGFPEMMDAEKAMIDHGVGDVISQSFGATENTFPGSAQGDYSSLTSLRYAFKDAAEHGVTVLGASGDNGATDAELDGTTLYPYRVNSWPSSDPLVTSVGGSQLLLDDQGNRLSPDKVWNDGYGAGGGGVSAVFPRPSYQSGVSSVVGSHRGTPDISMSAAVDGAAWTYSSYDPSQTGWGLVGGTSEATPIFSGVVALADQLAGHRLGLINPALYTLARLPSRVSGLVDIDSGNNSFGGVTGYTAGPGYDLASGLGTVNGGQFVRMLARLG